MVQLSAGGTGQPAVRSLVVTNSPTLAHRGPEEGSAECVAPLLDVTYYTDPLCCWSWAFEPVWRRVRYEWGDTLRWGYRMSGLIPDWSRFADPLNDISQPAHVGPQWLEVSRVSGMPIDAQLWHDDPPASSYPACLVVKAAELQGATAGERVLRGLREAAMIDRRNIAKRDVLLHVLEALERESGVPDVSLLIDALDDGSALAALRDDIDDARRHDIGRSPTLVVHGQSGPGIVVVGFRPYDALLPVLRRAAGEVPRATQTAACRTTYSAYWHAITSRLTEREIAEACGERETSRVEPIRPSQASDAGEGGVAFSGCFAGR